MVLQYVGCVRSKTTALMDYPLGQCKLRLVGAKTFGTKEHIHSYINIDFTFTEGVFP